MKNKKLIVALDYSNTDQAKEFINKVDNLPIIYKIGYQLFANGGIELSKQLSREGKSVFCDLKYLDIGTTITGGVRNIYNLGADFITIHAQGKSVQHACDAIKKYNGSSDNKLNIIGITLLTDQSNDESIKEFNKSSSQIVLERAQRALIQGANGLVASAIEAEILRRKFGNDFYLITPGIRRLTDNKDDQKRVSTPTEAFKKGASHIVMGRPITQALDPVKEINLILNEIS